MRILFVMASPEFLRFYDSTIRLLAERGHHVLLAVNKQPDAKPVRLEHLDATGHVEALGLVPRRDDAWTPMARLVRGAMDYARYLHPRFADAPALRQRLARKGLPPSLRGMDARLGTFGDGTVRRLIGGLQTLERGIPVSPVIEQFLARHRPDVVVVSPLVDVGSDQVDVVRAARRLGIRVVAAIASWDNLTNKGLLRVQPDAVLVWNEAQKHEAVALHGVPAERVIVTGAQLFDKWFGRQPARSLEAFTSRVGLPHAERFILFTGSSMFISAPEREVPFVKRWVEALRGSAHAALRDAPILIRPHPYNGWIWADVDMSGYPNVAVWPRGRYNPVDADERNDFFDSLYYSRAVVGINTSAMVEAAIIGRPVHSIVTDDFASTQEGTLHFHHLLPEHGGFLQIGRGFDHHLSLLAASLADEAGAREQTQRFVASFLRPHGLGQACTPLVADALEQVGAAPQLPDDGAALVTRTLARTLRPLANTLMRRPAARDSASLSERWRRARAQSRKRMDKAAKTASKRARQMRKGVRVWLKDSGA